MSLLYYPETIQPKDVQVWNNTAFDNGGNSEFSLSSLKNSSLDSCCTKENQCPSNGVLDSPVSIKSLSSIQPLQANNVVENAKLKEKNLDLEIEEIEKEISRLSSRLESLRLEKAKRNAKSMEKMSKVVANKFMDSRKKVSKGFEEERKNEKLMSMSAKLKTPRRGLSMGPSEIMRGMRRGISLGPAEIYTANKLKNKKEITPIEASANRRKSCYWKLNDIDELRLTKIQGKSMSVSPKSRSKTASKAQVPKQAATVIGCRKTAKKEDALLSSIQPKKLFTKDVEKSRTGKKPLRSRRVVPSRYNQITSGGSSALKELRKRSWPENEEDSKRSEKKRVSLVEKCQKADQLGTESRVKKRWEIPSEVVDKTPSVSKLIEVVPRIRTLRCANESPRDSGPAKRVAELVERKSFFSMDNNGDDDQVQETVCQTLTFGEDQVLKEFPKIRNIGCINESPWDSGAAKRISQLVGKKSFFSAADEDLPVFSFEEED